jgi:phage shock protein A
MNVYEQYALLKSKMTELENKEAELRTQILEEMVKKGEEKVETAMGSFKKATLKKWTYTDKVAELEEDFRARKALEQSTGDATFVEQPSLRFTPVKL